MTPREEELRRARAEFELEEAERRFSKDPVDRKLIVQASIMALVVHAAVLAVQLPDLSKEPVRVKPPEELMQIRFLQPPPPPPPPPPPEETPPPPPPERKRIPRPDPRPQEPEPIVTPPPPLPTPVPQQVFEPIPAPTAFPAPPEPTGPIRVTPGEGPGLIKRVEPEYPPAARMARIQGVVILDATITKEGEVTDIKVLRSPHPMLTNPAVEALKKWRFTPGEYDVVMTLTVNYVMDR